MIRSSAHKLKSAALGIASLSAAALSMTAPLLGSNCSAAEAAGTGEADVKGASVFAERCAVCHGPQAAGIPGSFPPLHEQVVAFARMPQGREYLIMVVTTGLMGNLMVGGAQYNGVMPAQSGLSEAEVAAVLTYLASDLGKTDSSDAALTVTEVHEARTRHPDRSAQGTRALRPATDR